MLTHLARDADNVTLNQLWKGFRRSHDAMWRTALILRYQGLVAHVANTIDLPSTQVFTRDDAFGHGTIGLIEALDRFKRGSPAKFHVYAARIIRGSILAALEELDVSPPQATEDGGTCRGLRKSRSGELRPPRRESALFPVDTATKSTNQTQGSPQTFVAQANSYPAGHHLLARSYTNPPLLLEEDEMSGTLRRALSKLSERERLVITRRYFHDTPAALIASELGVSTGRVYQIILQALVRLKNCLSAGHRSNQSLTARVPALPMNRELRNNGFQCR